MTALLPLLLPWIVLVDLVRQSRFAATRFLAFVSIFLFCEWMGIVGAFLIWCAHSLGRSRENFLTDNIWLQRVWSAALFNSLLWVFSIRLVVDGDSKLDRGPILLLLRHVSTADPLIPAGLVVARYGLVFRYVMKAELLWDPCIDIVGNRLPNCFLDRHEEHRDLNVQHIRKLAEGLDSTSGVVICPEGTRFSPRKRQRNLDKLRERGESAQFDAATALKNVLPAKPAGFLAVLDVDPKVDVAFCAHSGLETVKSIGDLVNGTLIGQVLQVHFTRVARAEVPLNRDERIRWLEEQWGVMDERIAEFALSSSPELGSS